MHGGDGFKCPMCGRDETLSAFLQGGAEVYNTFLAGSPVSTDDGILERILPDWDRVNLLSAAG